MRLENKVAFITGGTSGIGRATARLFVSEGAKVVVTGRRVGLGQQVAAETGGKFVLADHTRLEDCARSVAEAFDTFGRIDILFNNAGTVIGGTAEATSEEDWSQTLLLNVTAVWRMSKLVLPIMRRQGGGIIVNNASDWGVIGGREAVAYCASKGAVIQMTKAMALDHARENIRINAICPSDTFVERWIQDGYYFRAGPLAPLDEMLSKMGNSLPIGRIGTVEEIAKAVLFLASTDSSFITGTALMVDGGNTAQ